MCGEPTGHIKTLYYWLFVKGIHQWLVDSAHKGSVIWSFHVFFDISMNKLLIKHSSGWWFEMLQHLFDITVMIGVMNFSLSSGKISTTWCPFNSLAPGKFEWNFRYLILQIISVTDCRVISCELALRWMPLDFTDDKSILVQVMAWCHQATSHYLSQCWPRSLSPYGVIRPQWVKYKDIILPAQESPL